MNLILFVINLTGDFASLINKLSFVPATNKPTYGTNVPALVLTFVEASFFLRQLIYH